MFKKIVVVAMLLALPLALSAEILRVGQDAPTVEIAVYLAEDGDTLIVPETASFSTINTDGKDITVGVDAIEPEGAEPDSTIYGTNTPFPSTPLE